MEKHYLYKYTRTQYPDKKENYFDKIITNDSLWFSAPDKFNDIFDCNLDLRFTDISRDGLKETLRRAGITGKVRDGILNLDPVQWKEEISKRMNIELKKATASLGIFCGTTESTNLPMWAHYADQNTGVCLMFDPQFDSKFFGSMTGRVIYSDTPIDVTNGISEEVLYSFMFTKSTKWSYEDEIRLIRESEGADRFKKEALVGLIFGLKTPLMERDRIRNLLLYNGYKTNLYEISRNSYDNTYEIKDIL